MYAGLTPADKDALLDAQANHINWIAREMSTSLYGYEDEPRRTMFGWTLTEGLVIFLGTMEVIPFIGLHEKIHIPTALAQIAEMEREQEEPKFTIHGFEVEYLEMVAVLMRDHGITPEDVRKAALSWSDGAMMVFTAATKAIDICFINGTR